MNHWSLHQCIDYLYSTNKKKQIYLLSHMPNNVVFMRINLKISSSPMFYAFLRSNFSSGLLAKLLRSSWIASGIGGDVGKCSPCKKNWSISVFLVVHKFIYENLKWNTYCRFETIFIGDVIDPIWIAIIANVLIVTTCAKSIIAAISFFDFPALFG